MKIGKNSDLIDRCGIARVWALPVSHWANAPCAIHDREYLLNESGDQNKSRKQVDREFLRNMLSTAKGVKQKATAYLFYTVARVGGHFYW